MALVNLVVVLNPSNLMDKRNLSSSGDHLALPCLKRLLATDSQPLFLVLVAVLAFAPVVVHLQLVVLSVPAAETNFKHDRD